MHEFPGFTHPAECEMEIGRIAMVPMSSNL